MGDRARPRVLLLAKQELLMRLAELEAAIRSAGHDLTLVQELPERIDIPPTVVVCHLRSTLSDPQDISGYIRFLTDYHERRQSADSRLLVITPRFEEGPDRMVGYAALVDAYLTEPFTPDDLIEVLGRLAEEHYSQPA
jgi:DNA-binding response OmpR family regulator